MSEQVTKQEEKVETKFDIKHWVVVYINEFLEAFIFRIAMDKELQMYKIIQASAVIGLITFILIPSLNRILNKV